jgi:aspartyl-tRNA(Asn)/glutamyl-tRNA(Gln) amidotransferase subunit A
MTAAAEEMLDGSVTALADAVRAGAISAVEIAQATLDRIAARDGTLHAFLSTHEATLDEARALDDRRARGETLGPLAGVPVALKDALCTRHAPTTAGSKILEGYVPPYDATVVTRLRAAGALFPGKTNMDEFAMGSSTENSAYGPCKNPWDETRTPGGSSGGSAVAVASRMTPAALGSDTGGSIRQPAAFTGVVGVKPTYGRVPRYGLIAFASSLDQIGPLATDVRGAARVLDVIAGHDPRDATSTIAPAANGASFEASCERDVRGLRIGVPDEYFDAGLAADVNASVRDAIAKLEQSGCVIERISLPHTTYATATYYVIATAEASSNLARYDGIRFGRRADASDLATLYGKTRDAGLGREVKRRILLGTFVLSAGYYDAYYLKAQKVRTLVARDFDEAFTRVDAIACPTSATAAFSLGEKTGDPLAMYLSDVCTLPASLAGLPAISVPCAPTSGGLPVGLQLVGRAEDEGTLFALAASCERAYPSRIWRPD